MDGGAWKAAVHGVAKSRTRLSDFPFTFHFHALEKEMATHSSVLAWRIPGPGEPDGLPSLGSHRVRHDWSDLAAAAAATTLLWPVSDFILLYEIGFFVSILLQKNWEFEKFSSLPKGSCARKLGKQVSLIWSWVSHHSTILFLKAGLPSLACSFCFRVCECCSSGGHIGITWTALKSTDP